MGGKNSGHGCLHAQRSGPWQRFLLATSFLKITEPPLFSWPHASQYKVCIFLPFLQVSVACLENLINGLWAGVRCAISRLFKGKEKKQNKTLCSTFFLCPLAEMWIRVWGPPVTRWAKATPSRWQSHMIEGSWVPWLYHTSPGVLRPRLFHERETSILFHPLLFEFLLQVEPM